MAGQIMTVGCEQILRGYIAGNSMNIRLFSSAHTPAVGDTLATYTAIESAFPGYSNQLCTFGTVVPDGSNGGETDLTPAVFTVTGANAEFAFGYFAVDGASGELIGAELFGAPGPFDMSNAGTTLTVNVSLFEDPL